MISPTLRSGSGALLLAALFSLGGCSTITEWVGSPEGVIEPAKLEDFAATARFDVRWHADIGDAESSLLQPALTDDAIYGASGDGRLTRLDRASGKQLWRIESGIKVTGGVGAGEGLVLIGSDRGEVLAFDEKGKQRWKSQVSSEVLSVPKVSDGVVVVRSGDGHIVGLSAVDGKRLWNYERSTPTLVVRSHAGVTIQRGVAYAGFAGGKLLALGVKNGDALWESAVSLPRGNTELERISDITSDPVVDDEQVCAIAFQGRVACYDLMQGNSMWSREISSDKGLMLMRKNLYVTDEKGNVMVLDKSTGSTLWKNEQLFMRDTAAPYALGDSVVAGDYEGYLHGLSRDDGHFTARIKLGSKIQAAPQPLDDGLLVQTQDGDLYSLSLH